MSLSIDFFQSLAEYANKNWKGSFTVSEVRENAETYLSDFNFSNAKGECVDSIRFLICNLLEDAENGIEEALDFAQTILDNAEGWEFTVFYCADCDYRETVFFSATEMENIEKHSRREMLIQDAIPTKSPMVREWFVSGKCLCPECWKKYWGGGEE